MERCKQKFVPFNFAFGISVDTLITSFHYLFFEQPLVALLTFNMKEFTPQKFNDMIGCWLDWMIAKTNSLKVVLVGTQCDKMSKEKIKEVKAEVKKQMTEFKNYHKSILNKRINHIYQKTEISPTLFNLTS